MLFLVISHLSILAVLPFFLMSSKRPQSARQPAPMPAVEGYTDPQKERLEKKQRQNPVKTTRALNKFGEQLMTAALSTAINTVAPSGPVSSAAPVLGVPFEVPTKSARAATDSTSAVPSAAASPVWRQKRRRFRRKQKQAFLPLPALLSFPDSNHNFLHSWSACGLKDPGYG